MSKKTYMRPTGSYTDKDGVHHETFEEVESNNPWGLLLFIVAIVLGFIFL